jgi:hypothetical protein
VHGRKGSALTGCVPPAAASEYIRLRREHEGSEIVVVSLKEQLRELQARVAAMHTATREQVRPC